MYRPTFSWPRHQLEVSGQLHGPAALPPGKSHWYPLDRRWSGPQSRSRQCVEKNSWPYRGLNLDPSVVQPVASRCTDYAIPAPQYRVQVVWGCDTSTFRDNFQGLTVAVVLGSKCFWLWMRFERNGEFRERWISGAYLFIIKDDKLTVQPWRFYVTKPRLIQSCTHSK
jgi:hypothetical protein